MYKFGIIGLGKMGGAILNGILNANVFKKEDIYLCFDEADKQQKYNELGFNTTNSCNDIYNDCEIILLSVKPQSFPSIINKDIDFKGRCITSIMAGVQIKTLEEAFNNAYIFRLMPNTPALINSAVVTCAYNKENGYKDIVLDIFDSIGNTYIIDEEQMDATLPLNGSMPAYLYLFAKTFIEAGVKNGISYDISKELTARSIIASAKMILDSEDSIDTLINNVCSKGGTTIQGLYELYNKDNDFIKAIERCYEECMKRSIELSKN